MSATDSPGVRPVSGPRTRPAVAASGPGTSASRTSSTAASSPRSSARRPRGSTTSAGSAQSVGCRISTTSSFSARRSRAIRWRGTASAARPTSSSARGSRAEPLELKIPVTIAGMSFGALSAPAKEALGRGATEVGTSTTTGDGGMTPEEREHSKTLVYQLLPSRYGMNPDDLRKADAIEVVVGQGAKPGGGGMLLGHKISDRVAEMRSLPKGIDQRSASRHPDWTGPDDLEIKINELREITDWEKPVFVKVGRDAHVLRRAARGEGRRRRHRRRRHAGRDRRDAGRLHRARRDPDAARHAHRGRRPARARDAPEGTAHRLGWDPQRGGCREGARPRRGRGLDRDGSARRDGRQQPGARRGVSRDRQRRGVLRRLAGGPRPDGNLDAGRRAGVPLRPDPRWSSHRQLPARPHARDADARPRVRQVARAQPRAGRPRRAHGRGRGDGEGPAGRDGLDPGREARVRLRRRPSTSRGGRRAWPPRRAASRGIVSTHPARARPHRAPTRRTSGGASRRSATG